MRERRFSGPVQNAGEDARMTAAEDGGATMALALRNGVLPPTAGFRVADPDCDLDVAPNHARRAQVEFAVSNSFAFGGLNAVVVLRRFE